jgi:hypothetical protein
MRCNGFFILIDPHLVTFTELAVLIVFLAFIAASFLVAVPEKDHSHILTGGQLEMNFTIVDRKSVV